MNIAIDYDGTYTEDPNLWLAFIRAMLVRGHAAYVVTMRYPSECNGEGGIDKRLHQALVPVVCTSRQAKKPFCEEMGIIIDVWCDDHPEAVNASADQIWGKASPEGEVIIPATRSAAVT